MEPTGPRFPVFLLNLEMPNFSSVLRNAFLGFRLEGRAETHMGRVLEGAGSWVKPCWVGCCP